MTMISFFSSFCKFVLFLFNCVVVTSSMKSLGVTEMFLDSSDLRGMMNTGEGMEFGHLRHALFALKNRKQSFEVYERDNWDKEVKPDVFNQSLVFSTKSVYRFFDQQEVHYVSLDEKIKSKDQLSFISDSAIEHCSHTESELDSMIGMKVLLVGSEKGNWFSSTSVKSFFSLKRKDNPKHKQNSIFRIVKGIKRSISSNDNKQCVRFETEDIHYLELFQDMRVESFVDNPYQNNYNQVIRKKDENNNKKKKKRNLQSFVTPDLPVVSCGDTTYWGSGYWECLTGLSSCGAIKGDLGSTYQYQLGVQGCVSLALDLPGSFNANYDFNTGKAAKDPLTIPGLDGVSCVNCYAFLGAGMLLIMQYSSGILGASYNPFFRFEVKLAGGAGFNVDVEVVNPSISASRTIKGVIPEENAFKTFKISGTGLFIKYKFGGADVTVTGSGSTQGSLSAGAGASFSASAAVLYTTENGGRLSFPVSVESSEIQPFFKTSGFSQSSFDVAVALMATENFQFGLGLVGSSLSVNFDVKTTGTTEISFSSSRGSRKLQNNENDNSVVVKGDKSIYTPDDVIRIDFYYNQLPPNETTVLFYSLINTAATNGGEYFIMEKTFVSNTIGFGIFKSNWTIPWNAQYSNNGSDEFFIVVRSSSHILETHQSNPFHVSMFTDVDTIFSAGPKNNEKIKAETPILLKWNPYALHYFLKDKHSPYGGKEEIAYMILFNLVAEQIHENGTTVTKNIDNFINSTLINNGSCYITFPSFLAKLGSRFYLTINSANYSDIWGWSSGYFFIETLSMSMPSSLVRKLINNNNNKKKIPIIQFLNNNNNNTDNNNFKIMDNNNNRRRRLQSCSSSFPLQVKNGMTSGGGMTGSSINVPGIYNENFPTVASTQTATMQAPSTTCFDIPAGGPTAKPVITTIATPVTVPVLKPVSVPVYSPLSFPVSSTYSTGFTYLNFYSSSTCTGSVLSLRGEYTAGICKGNTQYSKTLIDTATCDFQFSNYLDSTCTILTSSSVYQAGYNGRCFLDSSGLYVVKSCGREVQSTIIAPSCTLTRYTDSTCSILSSFDSIPAGSCQPIYSYSAQCIITSTTGGVWTDYRNAGCTGTGTSAADSYTFTTGSCITLATGGYGRFSTLTSAAPVTVPVLKPVSVPVYSPLISPVSSTVTSIGYFGVAYYSDSKCSTTPFMVQAYYASGNCIPYNSNYAKINFDPTQTCSSSSSFFITVYSDSSCTIIYNSQSQVLLSKLGLTASSSECSSSNGLIKGGTIYGYGKLICSTTNEATLVSAPAYNLVTYANYGLTTPVCGTNPFYFSSATTSCITIGGVSGQVLPVTLSNGLRGIDFFSYSGTSCQGQGTQLGFLNYVTGSCSQSSFTYVGGAYFVNVPTFTSKIKADTTIAISLTGLTSDNIQSSFYIQGLTAAIAKVHTVTGALQTDAFIISSSAAVLPSFSPSLKSIVAKSSSPIAVISTNQPVIPSTNVPIASNAIPTTKPIQPVSTNLCLPLSSSSCTGDISIRCIGYTMPSCCVGGTIPSFQCVNGQTVCTCEIVASSLACDAKCVTKEKKQLLDETPIQLTFSLVSYFPANFDQSQIRSVYQNFPQIPQSDINSAIASRVPNVQVSSVQYSPAINLNIIQPTAQPINAPGVNTPTISIAPPTVPGDSGGGSSPNTGLIIGATIGSVVGGLLLLVGCYLMYDHFYLNKSEDVNESTAKNEFTSPPLKSPRTQKNEYSIRLDNYNNDLRNVEFSLSRELREDVKRSSVKVNSPKNREYSDQRKSRSPNLNNMESYDDSEISVSEAEISVIEEDHDQVDNKRNSVIRNTPQKHDINSNRKSMNRKDFL